MQNASESNKLCQQKYSSGRLAYIPSANAEYFMERALQSQFGNERGSGVWIGVFDNIQEGKFVDTDGEPQKYFNWRYDQPNDPNRNVDGDPAQDCVRSFPHDRHDIFSWQDKPCKENGLAICSINLHK
ncbi:hypothetical protein FSP39_011732 [Pinctada imbricata]|uniref:C-type lectin domain-containing protein n=1 Tax=Pinctada imbricata TaxID=66713 RepID=A0AA89C759_PINIB|nr:hypothetical protein FSP39_011732 [Pinctada imbricata]